MSMMLCVEGGGENRALQIKCRQGFAKLMENSRFIGRLPKVAACGSRNVAFKRFQTEFKSGKRFPILLVDSEDLVDGANGPDNPYGAWRHLADRDGWQRPKAASDDQAQLMVTTMETWLVADPSAVIKHFPGMSDKKSLPSVDLESRTKKDILAALNKATSGSQKGEYKKGRDSFDLLGKLNPEELKTKLPYFRRFAKALDAIL